MWTISLSGWFVSAGNGFTCRIQNNWFPVDVAIDELERIVCELRFNPISARVAFDALMTDVKPRNELVDDDLIRALNC